MEKIDTLAAKIRNIPDFPKPGIQFKDISTLLADAEALQEAVEQMAAPHLGNPPDYIVAVEARGFLFGVALALKLGCGFVPVRKPGKLPSDTFEVDYELEYGTDTLQMHKDAMKPGDKALIVDDLLATGGTVGAVEQLIEKCGGKIIGYSFLIELTFLPGREKLNHPNIHSLIQYSGD